MQSLDELSSEIQNSTFHEQQSTGENLVNPMVDNNDQQAEDEPKWWENESQFLLSSQQLVEGLSICDEFLQSQSPDRDGNDPENKGKALRNDKPRLSDYAQLGPESLKKDLEECQNLDFDLGNDIRLSQLVRVCQFSPLFLSSRKSLT